MSIRHYNRIKRIVKEQLDVIEEEKMTGELEDVEKVAADVPETDASEYASALEQDIDFMKALKIHLATYGSKIIVFLMNLYMKHKAKKDKFL